MPEMEGSWEGKTWLAVELRSWDEDEGRYHVMWPHRKDLCLSSRSPYYGGPDNTPSASSREDVCYRYPWEVRETQPQIRNCGKPPMGKVTDVVDPLNTEVTVGDGVWLSKGNSGSGMSKVDHADEYKDKQTSSSVNSLNVVLGIIIFFLILAIMWAMQSSQNGTRDLERREVVMQGGNPFSGGGSKTFSWSRTAQDMKTELAKVNMYLKAKVLKVPNAPGRNGAKTRSSQKSRSATATNTTKVEGDSYIREKGFTWNKKEKQDAHSAEREVIDADTGLPVAYPKSKNPYTSAVYRFFHGFEHAHRDKVAPQDIEVGIVTAAEAGIQNRQERERQQAAAGNVGPGGRRTAGAPVPAGAGGTAKRSSANATHATRAHAPSRSPARISNVSTRTPGSRENSPRGRARSPNGDDKRAHTPDGSPRRQKDVLQQVKRSKSAHQLQSGRKCHSARAPVTMTKMDLGPNHDLPHFGRRGRNEEIDAKRKRTISRSLTPPRWDEGAMQYTTVPPKTAVEAKLQISAAAKMMKKEGLGPDGSKKAPQVEWQRLNL